MLYSIISEDNIVEEDEMKQKKEVEINGVTMEVDLDNPYSGKVTRIISSNPQDYLNNQLGTKVKFGPDFE
ncbi:hypothetical protein Halha_0732 [Halobacteroides halobius DSM 5150]|uniref:YlzJ-like protein n=1 Tax=Halobacteroides halobius (strain ATCC 35273 / DSM 5150 / MD-1) TaxID=748449 RepID=L0K831_HALHC|nr:YlzJ-like family protein [Halobacteroides halobius]AGB40705.1 hypothetical protein Halha_0732 [Halobacteroides halobius DSM 5150]